MPSATGSGMPRQDPWLTARMRADVQLRRGERKIYDAVILAMTEWLDAARALVLHQPLPASLTAAADEPPDIDAAQASFIAWMRGLENHIEPVVQEAFGEAFAAQSRRADISPVHFQEQHMAEVHNRLVIWPEGAFEELRPELLEAMAQNEDTEKITDRIGRILDIDAPTRRIRADIADIDRAIADPETPPEDISWLKGRRRDAWNQHDESQKQWKWLARRIARTEIQGAVEGGSLAAAQAMEDAGGSAHYKRWLSTTDERTRRSHSVADGQIVRLTEPFTVGGFPLMHPAFPGGPAHEVINCRCTLLILDDVELQEALQGPWGGQGVGPGNARMGPDDPADVAVAVDRLKREQAGEVIEHTPIGVRPEPEAATAPDIPTAAEDDGDIVIHIGGDNDEDQHDDVDVPSDEPELEPDAEDLDTAPDPDGPGPDETVDEADTPADAPDEPEPVTPEVVEAPRPRGGPTPEEGAALAAQLDEDYAEPIAQLTPEQRDAIQRWQGTDRFYRRVQDVLRNEADDDEAADVADTLLPVILGNTLQSDVVVYRGIRNVSTLIRRTNSDLDRYVGQQIPSPGFLAASTSREEAASAFTRPFIGGGPALFELTVRAGTPAFWVSGAGDPEMADQRELLMGATTTLLITSVDYSGDVPTVQAEVI